MKFAIGHFQRWSADFTSNATEKFPEGHPHGLAPVALGPVHYARIFNAGGGGIAAPAFVPPVAPIGPRPAPPLVVNALLFANFQALAVAHDRTSAEYKAYIKAYNELKAIAIGNLADVDLQNPVLNNPEFGFINTSLADIYGYMYTKYGVATPQQVRANITAMSEKWNPTTSSLEEHIVRLNVRFLTAAQQHNNPVSEPTKIQYLRESLLNGPNWVKVACDLYERSVVNPAAQALYGPNNDGLAQRLIAEAARVSDDMAGARGFAGAAEHEHGDGSANAATQDRASNAEVTQLKRENAQLRATIAKLEKANGESIAPRKCATCGTSFTPPRYKLSVVDCKSCFDAHRHGREPKKEGKEGKKP